MLGLVLIYFVGKQFYDMAKKYDQSAWLYAILGVVSYYGGIIAGGVILGVIIGLFFPEFLDTTSETVLGLMTIPIGILACWGFYQLLKRKWTKDFEEKERNKPKIEDIGKSEEEKPTEDFLIGNRNLDDLGKKKDDGFRF
ncbi:hypothetical protein U8527_15175 [Kordia algicida OT-1]|uniref:Uncharacterized protein n=1 Tax=Kordia algicida OT-1 TaxID=391587 RepID=A9E7F0_9FLAO|nr:hypothetical protein [Kordia algicida]EDP94895.1 hypothetical protein KAOT1_08779 [Kordia algicida OT-1]